MENTDAQTMLIGELLIKAGMLSKDDLDDALEIAHDSGQLIGRVLIMSGFITDHQLQVTLKAQEYLRNNKVGLDAALRAVRMAVKSEITFDQAMVRQTIA